MVDKIFYQTSLPRAGSTLMQNILAQNPEFYASPTSGLVELLMAARATYSNSDTFKAQDEETMRNAFLSFSISGILGYYNSIAPNYKYAIDKSRQWGYEYRFVEKIFGEKPKMIVMIRDLRDVFASMEKNFWRNPDKDKNMVNYAELRNTTVEKRIDTWSQQGIIAHSLDRIRQNIIDGTAKDMLFVKHEHLTENPERTMRMVYDYLEVPYYEGHDFNNVEQKTFEDDRVHGDFGDHIIRQKIEPVPSRAVELLGVHGANWIKENYAWFYNEFKY